SLEELYLHDNNLSELPKSLINLKNIRRLDLRNNTLEKIPYSLLASMKNLEELYIEGNPISEKDQLKIKGLARLLPKLILIDHEYVNYF
ncbi:MAG: leucine-rich repeat domain-containing protein, partial [Candidatus Heimdallarchaeota archaeon]